MFIFANIMKQYFLLMLGVLMSSWVMAQTVVVLDLPDPCSVWDNPKYDQASNISFELAPNPVGDYAFFSVESPKNNLGKIVVELTDMSRQSVLRKEYFSEQNRFRARFETRDLKTGIYVVTIRCNVGVLSKKMIKR